MRLGLIFTAIILAGLAISAEAVADPVGWCPWLPWTCETQRSPRWDGRTETVECRMRRRRYCCNSEPPVQTSSCPGPATGRRDRGGEQWRSSSRGLQCPPDPRTNYSAYSVSLKVNACSTAYPVSDGGYPTVWCPWLYWSTWDYATDGACGRMRTRSRRCSCPSTSRLTTAGVCLGQPASASAERQEQTLNCFSRGCTDALSCSGVTNVTIVDGDPHSPIPIVVGCLAVLIAVAAAVTVGIVCAALCKKKRAAAAAASQRHRPNFAARLASSFRRGFAVPTAPAYGSAAYFGGGVPVPTVSLKVAVPSASVADGADGSPEQPLPPPYSSQPELPRGGGSGAARAPPPYSWSGIGAGATWDSPPVEP